MEGDALCHRWTLCAQKFLSTPSGWRATRSINSLLSVRVISIHALRVEGDIKRCAYCNKQYISIHALRVEGDRQSAAAKRWKPYFYPRPPGGGRLCWMQIKLEDARISIHALRVEGDLLRYGPPTRMPANFYPRPPGGGRPCSRRWDCLQMPYFYPRPPGGGRHCALAPLGMSANDFYPRPPGGGRQQKRTKFSSVFAQKGEEFASLRRGKRKICRWRFKKDKFWVLIWCEGSGKSVCALASHCG